MQSWNGFEGKSLAGTYPLGNLLRTEGSIAWFTTRYQEKAAVALVSQSGSNDDSFIANLEAAAKVRHANIVRIDRVGRASMDGNSFVYAILEPTEENLAEVLRDRALTPDETSQITESLVAALAALHEHGLVHGLVSIGNVFAAGDTVKLRSDCVQKASPAAKIDPETYAQDVGDMGALVFEALTQRKLTSAEDPSIAKLPAPFGPIVQSSVTGRWGLTDIAAALKKPAPGVSHPIPASAEPAKVKAAPPVKAPPVAAPAASAAVAAQQRPLSATTPQKGAAGGGVRVLALLGIVIAIGVIYYFYRSSQNQPAPAAGTSTSTSPDSTSTAPAAEATAPPVVATTNPVPQPPPKPSSKSVKKPAPATPQQQAVPEIPADASTSTGSHKIWRVVVYAYGDQTKAQQKVDALLAQHPDLKPEVFTPNGHGPYLVTVGGPMERQQAFALRSQLGGQGLPGDSYAQNYSH